MTSKGEEFPNALAKVREPLSEAIPIQDIEVPLNIARQLLERLVQKHLVVCSW